MNTPNPLMRAVEHALVAQGCIMWARLEPEAAPGLLKAADHHRRRAAAMVEECRSGGQSTGEP